MEGKKLPRAVLRENKLHVDGQEHPYVRGMIRSLSIEVRDLVYTRSYDINEGKGVAGGRINGTAVIQRGDSLAVAGSDFRTREIPFGVRAVGGEEDEHAWTCHIGFLPHDWEITRLGEGDAFYVEVYVPNTAFADLEGAYLAGRASSIDVALDTDLWVREGDWYIQQSGHVTWHLVPSDKPSDMPRAERGRVERFGWKESPPGRDKPPI
ncbi:MAG: hypothetical protein JWR89_2893, partial [Tardiphaga sp.]|uniref:hypothetical protein n=1 Tax=Tardiphaga sp. TaxID=1926292 RepID=UPI00261A29D7